MGEPLYFQTAATLGARLEKGEITSVELTKAILERTKQVESKVKAFICFDEEDALNQARASDERRQAGQALGPLDGIPVGIKDALAVAGQPLTCASRMLKDFISPYDATTIRKLKEAGAVIWGRLNMDEFAMGSSTENSSVHTTNNPWNLDHIPGGSSGGSAAAVAAGETILSLGSDTGGSIRQPASLCGTIGLKPTYGLVSRYGLAAFASSLDQVGPFARTVEDAAIILQAIAGHDHNDSTSFTGEVPDYRAALTEKKGPWKIGIPKEYFGEGLDPEVEKAVQGAIDFYRNQGCEIVDVSLPHTDYGVAAYCIIATAEASSNMARYDGVRYTHRSAEATDAVDLYFKSRAEGFGSEVKRRILLGTYVLSSGYYDAYYIRAQKVRSLIRNDFVKAFEKVDVIMTPTSPDPAMKRGENKGNLMKMYLSDVYTIGANLAGIPGISLPCGFTSERLPIGLQILSKPFGEANLLAIAHTYEQAHDHYRQHPDL